MTRMTEKDLSALISRSASSGKQKPFTLEASEAAIQSAILRAIKIHPAVAWHGRFNSGAQVIGEGKSKRFVRFSSVKGLSDILGQLVDGRFLAIEVKATSGRATKDQAAFIDTVKRSGGVAFVARSVSQVFEVLDGVVRSQIADKEKPASQAGKPQRVLTI